MSDTERKMAVFSECPDCGAPKEATLVLGFACEYARCPMMLEQYSPAVQKAMGRFWKRYDEVESEKAARASDAANKASFEKAGK